MKIRLSGSSETVALWASFISQRVDCRISKEYDNRSGDVRVYIDVGYRSREAEAGRRIAPPHSLCNRF